MNLQKTINEDIQGIKEVLSVRTYFAVFVAITVFLWVVYAILTDIIVITRIPAINPELNFLNMFLITTITVLSSLVLVLTVYRLKKNWQINNGEKTGFLGSILGAFATACPVCQPIWLIWLGFGQASLFLTEISTYIALASTALLLFSLHLVSQSIYVKTCKV